MTAVSAYWLTLATEVWLCRLLLFVSTCILPSCRPLSFLLESCSSCPSYPLGLLLIQNSVWPYWLDEVIKKFGAYWQVRWCHSTKWSIGSSSLTSLTPSYSPFDFFFNGLIGLRINDLLFSLRKTPDGSLWSSCWLEVVERVKVDEEREVELAACNASPAKWQQVGPW